MLKAGLEGWKIDPKQALHPFQKDEWEVGRFRRQNLEDSSTVDALICDRQGFVDYRKTLRKLLFSDDQGRDD